MKHVFLCYSHQDSAHRDSLREASRRLEAAGLMSLWHDQEIRPSQPWAEEIRRKLDEADLVLALVSPAFLESPWCVAELARAFEQRERNHCDVLPVVVRPCAWRETELGAIQAAPAGGVPIESWVDQGAGWKTVVDAIEAVLRGEHVQPAFPSREALSQQCAELLEAERRLMILAPWRGGLVELGLEVARRTHGSELTVLRLPALEDMGTAEFYREVSADASVVDAPSFRKWLQRSLDGGRHLFVLPYFGGPTDAVRELGHAMRGIYEQDEKFSLLVLGLARCAALLQDASHSLFSGILTKHVDGMDERETGTLLQRMGADPQYAPKVNEATGGHPEWTALSAPEVRRGRLQGLPRYLADLKVYNVLHDRLFRASGAERQHTAATLEKLLKKQRVVALRAARDDLSYPEVRLYYDGLVVDRNGETMFRCEAVRLAAEQALAVWSQRA